MIKTTDLILEQFVDNQILEYFEIEKKVCQLRNTCSTSATRKAVNRLVNSGKIYKIAKNTYGLNTKVNFVPQVNRKLKIINNLILKEFPRMVVMVWTTEWLNFFSHNLYADNYIIIEVEKGYEEAVYDVISTKYKNVYLLPTNEEYQKYIGNDDVIVVKTKVTRSPHQMINGIEVPAIEKIIIDTAADKDAFFWMSGKEWERFLTNIIRSVKLDFTTLFYYAKRRSTKNELEKTIIETILENFSENSLEKQYIMKYMENHRN